jgi:hypothetical protein
MTRGEFLYSEFLKNFPRFKPMVKQYKKVSNNSVEIETKIGKKFIFTVNKDGIDLNPA